MRGLLPLLHAPPDGGRKRKVHYRTKSSIEAIAYIQATKKIRDVLISGGDPLLFEDDRSGRDPRQSHKIPHVEIIRIGTRVPVTLPQRITPSLTAMLKKYHPLWISIHFTHPKEITKEVRRACGHAVRGRNPPRKPDRSPAGNQRPPGGHEAA